MNMLKAGIMTAVVILGGCAGSNSSGNARDHVDQIMALPDGGSISSSLKRQGAIGLGGPESIVGDGAGHTERSAEVINDRVWATAGALEFCYKDAVRAGDPVKGTVTVQFTISFSGLVKEPMVLRSDIGNDDLAECLARTFGTMAFSQIDKGDGSVTVVYPVVLGPSVQ